MSDLSNTVSKAFEDACKENRKTNASKNGNH